MRGKVQHVYPELLRQLIDWTPGDTAAQQAEVLRYLQLQRLGLRAARRILRARLVRRTAVYSSNT